MQLTVLGCSAGIGGARRTTSLLLDDDILIDAGSGAGELSLDEMARVDHVFLTHSHLDHSGFVPLLADAAAFMRDKPLLAHALPETIEALKSGMFNGALWPDYTVKPSPEKPYIRLVPIAVGVPISIGNRIIIPLPACHSVPALGYCMDSGKASFAFSGDTAYCEAFWDALNGIENLRYLMIEVTLLNAQAASGSGHMSAELLVQGLNRLKRKVELFITHLEPGKEERIMDEVGIACERFSPVRMRQGQRFIF